MKKEKVMQSETRHEVIWTPSHSTNDAYAAAIHCLQTDKTRSLIVLPNADNINLLLCVLKNFRINYTLCGSNEHSKQLDDRGIVCSADLKKVAPNENPSQMTLISTDFKTISARDLLDVHLVIQLFLSQGNKYSMLTSIVRRNSNLKRVTILSPANKAVEYEKFVSMGKPVVKITPDCVIGQRNVEEDELRDIVKQIEENCNFKKWKKKKLGNIESDVTVNSTEPKKNDFFSDINADLISKSLKKKRKRTKKKKVQTIEKEEASSADDSEDESDNKRRKKKKKSHKKIDLKAEEEEKPDHVDISRFLTDITSTGIQRARKDLTYEEKRDYKQRQNAAGGFL